MEETKRILTEEEMEQATGGHLGPQRSQNRRCRRRLVINRSQESPAQQRNV